MADAHDRIEELLAGYLLRALSGSDAAEADRLLAEHVPACPRCRDTLDGLAVVAGDLALGAPPATPPETLLARVRREVAGPSPSRHRVMPLAAVAAGVAAVLAVGGFAMTLEERASRAERHRGTLTAAIQQMSAAGLQPVALREEEAPAGARLLELPGSHRLYLVGMDVPPPAPGHVYRLWLGSGGAYTLAAEFVPEGGLVVLELEMEHQRYDEIVVTEEPEGPPGDGPAGVRRWSSRL